MSIPKTDAPLYIDGSWRVASGPSFEVFDPSNAKVLARVPSATTAEVHEALAADKASCTSAVVALGTLASTFALLGSKTSNDGPEAARQEPST